MSKKKSANKRDTSRERSIKPPARSSAMARIFPRLWIYGLIIGTCLLIYGRTVGYNVTGLDDDTLIGAFAGHHYTITEAFTSNAFMVHKGADFYRPLQSLTFIVNAAISGASPSSYHLFNLIIHCLTVCCLLQLLLLLGFERRVSAVAALAYAATPLFAQAVAWVPGRGDLLLGLFGTLSFSSLLKYRQTGNRLFLAAHGAALFLAALSKETGIALPALFLLYLLLIDRAKAFNLKSIQLLPVWICTAVGYLLLRHTAISSLPVEKIFGIGPFIGNLRVLPETLAGLIVPWDIPVMPAFSLSSTIVGLLVAAGLAIALAQQERCTKPLVVFGFAWFVILSIPGMMYTHELGSHAYNYLNHRSYLPMVGIFLVLVEAVPASWRKAGRWPFVIGAAGLVILLCVLAIRQTGYFADPQAFYNQAVRTNPASALALNNRGRLEADGGDPNALPNAMRDYNLAIQLFPRYAMAYNNRANARGQASDLPGAIEDLTKAVTLDSTYALGFSNLGRWKAMVGDTAGAMADYNRAIRLDPHFAGGYNNRGALLGAQGRYDRASADFQAAIDNDPNFSEAMLNLGLVKLDLGDLPAACVQWQKASRLGNQRARAMLAQHCR